MKLGANDIATLKLGAEQVDSVYLGSDLVWTDAVFGFGNGLVADGIDDFVSGIGVNLNVLSNGFSFWAVFDDSFGVILGDSAAGLNNLLLLNNLNNVRFYTSSGSQRNLDPNITLGQKNHYLFSQDATHIYLYKDGVLIDSDTSNGISIIDTVAAYSSGSLFLGLKITELAICSNYTPTAQDAIDLYNSGSGATATDVLSNVVRYYKTNEADGAVTLIDAAGNQNATLNNFSTPPAYFEVW